MRALITGINGQDGIFLSKLLVSKGVSVLGIGTNPIPSPNLPKAVSYLQCDVRNTIFLRDICFDFLPDHIYNLAGISSVAQSFKEPQLTQEVNYLAVKNLLEIVELLGKSKEVKFYQSSSSEMFGESRLPIQNEESPLAPISPYAESKVLAHEACRQSRKNGLFVASGILYNHESIYRSTNFVSRRITSQVAKIATGEISSLIIGNLEAKRDWGFAGDYVDAIWLMMNQKRADEFVVATGKAHSVKELVDCALSEIYGSYTFEEIVKVDSELFRPKDISCLIGDSRKAQNELGWRATTTFEEMIKSMVRSDIEYLRKN